MLDRLQQLTILPHEPVGWAIVVGATVLVGWACAEGWRGRREAPGFDVVTKG